MTAATGETLVRHITHYYSHLNVGSIELTDGDLNVGDTIHIKGKHTDFTQTDKRGKGPVTPLPHWG